MSKLLSTREAVSRFVPDGASVLLGAGLESLIPFSAGQELIRQGRRDLTLIAPISDVLFDQILGAGVAGKVVAAWVGNVSSGSGYNFRRALEEAVPRAVEMVDHSNFTLALALHAAALGVPYLPTYSTLGSDLARANPDLTEHRAPFTGEPLMAVKALAPDVAFLAVQRADSEGNAHLWGNLGVAPDAARAARSVVLMAEEIVPAEVIASDPNRTLIPGFLVAAVVREPLGCHPSPCQGYYNRDHRFYSDYHEKTRTRPGFLKWLEEWVLSLDGRESYLKRLGEERLASLAVRNHAPSAPADFGW
jgi:glutaconate CoA-transferase subunit A